MPWTILFAGLLTFASAQPQISITPDRTRVGVGEQIQITVRIVSNKRLNQITPPPLAPTEFFNVARTSQDQSQNTSIQIVNGRMEQKVEITYLFYYLIVALKDGSFTFPALQYAVDGGTLATPPIPMTVTKEAVQNPDVSARVVASKSDLYVGEQAILTLQVSVKAQSAAQLTQEGFSACLGTINKALGSNFAITNLFREITGVQERQGGEFYRVYRARFAIFPLNAGTARIPQMPLQYVVQKRVQAQRRGDPFFDDFFGGFFGASVQQVPQSVVTNGLSINVKALPPAPAGFSGAVGTGFSLVADVDPKTVPTGDAVTLKIALRGATRPGNLGEIKLPPLDAFEAFTPEKSAAVDTTEHGLVTRRAYKYLLIAQQEGAHAVPPIRWTYFDPAAGSYRSLTTDSLRVEVTKGKGGKKDGARYLTQAEIREVGKDIHYIKTGTHVRNQPAEPYKNPILYILYPLPFLWALFIVLYRMQATRQRDVAKMLRSKALSRARRELVEAEKSAGSVDMLLGKIAGVIERFISHKFGFPASGRTLDELRQELVDRGVDAQVVTDLAAFIETMDRYRFGGGSAGSADRKSMLSKTATFVEQLERASRKEGKR